MHSRPYGSPLSGSSVEPCHLCETFSSQSFPLLPLLVPTERIASFPTKANAPPPAFSTTILKSIPFLDQWTHLASFPLEKEDYSGGAPSPIKPTLHPFPDFLLPPIQRGSCVLQPSVLAPHYPQWVSGAPPSPLILPLNSFFKNDLLPVLGGCFSIPYVATTDPLPPTCRSSLPSRLKRGNDCPQSPRIFTCRLPGLSPGDLSPPSWSRNLLSLRHSF